MFLFLLRLKFWSQSMQCRHGCFDFHMCSTRASNDIYIEGELRFVML
jgi:hypothetical protein